MRWNMLEGSRARLCQCQSEHTWVGILEIGRILVLFFPDEGMILLRQRAADALRDAKANLLLERARDERLADV